MKHWRVGILGATGIVGQRFIQLLEQHPWFTVTAVAASDRSEGKRYGDAVAWKLPTPLPARIAEMTLAPCRPPLDCDLVFSSLPGEMAGETEAAFAAAGYPVISNSSACRMSPDVPLLVPEINPEHARLIPLQQQCRNWTRGFLVTNPNCTTLALALPLAALERAFGVEMVIVSTMQAISGAGYPGVASLDIVDNVIPYIAGEEEKVESEPRKILGRFTGDRIELAAWRLSAHCHRVAVTDGHLCAASIKLRQLATVDEVCAALEAFRGPAEVQALPSAPTHPIVLRPEPDRPQPRLDRELEHGMASIVGRVRPDPLLDVKMTILGHNTIRGAAGAAVLNAEFLSALGYLA
ncbi:MAG: aspartate-semialdehyde dehydrogenase [Acidobacteriota bacterium]